MRTCNRRGDTEDWADLSVKPDDVRLGSTPGNRPRSPATPVRAAPHEPDRHARIEAALEEIEGKRPWRNEEDEDPDGPVVESVMEFVPLPDLALRGVLDGNRCHQTLHPQDLGLRDFHRSWRGAFALTAADLRLPARRV